MTLLDVEELCDYWKDHPPVHISVAAYLGIGSDAPSRASANYRPAVANGAEVDPMIPMALMGLPKGPPISAVFGPGALDEIMALQRRYEANEAAAAATNGGSG
jgi:hypothetical protein